MRYARAAGMLIILNTAGCASPRDDVARLFDAPSRFVDLTYEFGARTVYWPTADPFVLDTVAAGVTEAGYYYAANNFRAAEHGGTHLDAPVHFAEGGWSAEEVPLHRMIGRAVVIDVSGPAADNADYRAQLSDVQQFEAVHGQIPDGTIVLFRTGWGRRWRDRAAYLGTDATGPDAVPLLHFPGVSARVSRWLVDERRVRAVGIDTPSIDYGQSSTYDAHRILSAQNVVVFENVANLELLPETGAYVLALPMKIAGGSGAPLRIIGIVPE